MLWRPGLSLCAVTLASYLSARDGPSILNALTLMNLGLQRIDTAILGLQGGNGPALAQLIAAGSATVVENVTAVVEASAPLDLSESQSLTAALDAIAMNLNLTIIDGINQKPLFDALNLTAMFAGGFVELRTATARFTQALNQKLSSEAQLTIASLAQLESVFQLGQDFFNGVNPGIVAELPPIAAGGVTTGQDIRTGQGIISGDGSCHCAVECGAGSSNMVLV